MVAFTVVHGSDESSAEKTTLHVEGDVTSDDWEKLRELCLRALKKSDRLVLDLRRVGAYDYSLGMFVCLLRRTVQLLNKHLAVKGKQQDNFLCVYEAALKSRTTWCSFAKAPRGCLWENLYTVTTFHGSLSKSAGLFGTDGKCGEGGCGMTANRTKDD
jgi:ABC-type transporter Mla MlaB component